MYEIKQIYFDQGDSNVEFKKELSDCDQRDQRDVF